MLGPIRRLLESWRETSRRYDELLDEIALEEFERQREAPEEPDFPTVADESQLER
jgi:hypothetical protein